MSRGDWVPVLQNLTLPEGPAVRGETVACVDVRAGAINFIQNGEPRRIEVGGQPNGAAFDGLGSLILADSGRNAILRAELPDGKIETLCDEGLQGPNDLLVEGKAVTFTDPGDSGLANRTGRVLRLTPDGLEILANGLAFPNGLARRADGTLLVAETKTGRVLSLEDGRVEPVAEGLRDPDGSGGPDGLALLPDGSLAVAVFRTSRIAVLRYESPVSFLLAPGSRPTNLCHDGGLLYCTEADTGALWSRPLERVRKSAP